MIHLLFMGYLVELTLCNDFLLLETTEEPHRIPRISAELKHNIHNQLPVTATANSNVSYARRPSIESAI